MHCLFKACKFIWPACLLMLWLGAGCARQQIAGPQQPVWTVKGSGAYTNSQGRMFYGVGTAAGIGNRTLLRATADNHAQDEMAGLLNEYMAALVKSVEPGGLNPEMEQAVYSLTKKILSSAVIGEHWTDTGQEKLFALCSLELETLKQILKGASPLDGRMRVRMAAQADRVHAELAAAMP